MAVGLLGADAKANAVHECPVLYLGEPIRFVAPAGVICARASAACDLNNDGRADVRDLVLMIHCVLQSGDCPPTPRASSTATTTERSRSTTCCAGARRILFGFPPRGPRAARALGPRRLRRPVEKPGRLDLPLR